MGNRQKWICSSWEVSLQRRSILFSFLFICPLTRMKIWALELTQSFCTLRQVPKLNAAETWILTEMWIPDGLWIYILASPGLLPKKNKFILLSQFFFFFFAVCNLVLTKTVWSRVCMFNLWPFLTWFFNCTQDASWEQSFSCSYFPAPSGSDFSLLVRVYRSSGPNCILSPNGLLQFTALMALPFLLTVTVLFTDPTHRDSIRWPSSFSGWR